MKYLKIGENDSGQRLNKFIEKTFPKFPKSAIYKAIRTKKIKINKRCCQANYILELGDIVNIFGFSKFVEESKQHNALKLLVKGELKIVYEDKNLIIVDKPVGLCSHPCRAGGDSLISRILNYFIESGKVALQNENSFLPGICNRLDVDTSGLVVAAKNFEALRCFNELLKSRKIIKTYCCLAEGVFEKSKGTLVNWLQKNYAEKKAVVKKSKFLNAKKAILHYFVIQQFSNFAKIRVVLKTGRFHQIRAQLSFIGHPLLGDLKYGASETLPIKLRASSLFFNTENSMFDYLNGRKIELEINF